MKIQAPNFIKHKKSMICNQLVLQPYQWRKELLCCPAWNRKAAMCAGVTGSQSFAEELSGVFAWL